MSLLQGFRSNSSESCAIWWGVTLFLVRPSSLDTSVWFVGHPEANNSFQVRTGSNAQVAGSVAMHGAMRPGFGYGFESCEATDWKCQKPKNLEKQRPVSSSHFLLVVRNRSWKCQTRGISRPPLTKLPAFVGKPRLVCQRCTRGNGRYRSETCAMRKFESLAKRCGETSFSQVAGPMAAQNHDIGRGHPSDPSRNRSKLQGFGGQKIRAENVP